jgi:hypothetical protein
MLTRSALVALLRLIRLFAAEMLLLILPFLVLLEMFSGSHHPTDRAVVKSGVCPEANSTHAVITVNPIPTVDNPGPHLIVRE